MPSALVDCRGVSRVADRLGPARTMSGYPSVPSARSGPGPVVPQVALPLVKCRICDCEDDFAEFTGFERMYGSREQFRYVQCPGCGCLQIEEMPHDLGRYYPTDYYSFASSSRPPIQAWLKLQRNRHAMGHRAPVGAVLGRLAGPPEFLDWVKHVAEQSPRVLDVGSGSGALVSELRAVGIDAMGADPYLDADLLDADGEIVLRSCDLSAIEDEYDLVMFHHSLEHIWDQRKVLQQARSVVRQTGTVLVRVPLVDSYAWREFGANWVQMDAPRHLYLHTRRSMSILAARSGFIVEKSSKTPRCSNSGAASCMSVVRTSQAANLLVGGEVLSAGNCAKRKQEWLNSTRSGTEIRLPFICARCRMTLAAPPRRASACRLSEPLARVLAPSVVSEQAGICLERSMAGFACRSRLHVWFGLVLDLLEVDRRRCRWG